MSDKENGGAAFPVVHPDGMGAQYFGMSLRDYFAAKAVQGMLANDSALARFVSASAEHMIDPDVMVATSAYSIADAMLKERDK